MLLGRHRSAERRAFSLVELLVILGILAVLIGMLMPALRSTREAGRRTVCLSNLRQIGIGLSAYLVNGNRFPEVATEPVTDNPLRLQSLADVLKVSRPARALQCPNDYYDGNPAAIMARARLSAAPETYFALEGTSYAYPMLLSGRSPTQVAAGRSSSIVVTVADFGAFHRRNGDEGANALFLDGHAEAFDTAQ